MKHLPRDGKTGWTADATLQPTGRVLAAAKSDNEHVYYLPYNGELTALIQRPTMYVYVCARKLSDHGGGIMGYHVVLSICEMYL